MSMIMLLQPIVFVSTLCNNVNIMPIVKLVVMEMCEGLSVSLPLPTVQSLTW